MRGQLRLLLQSRVSPLDHQQLISTNDGRDLALRLRVLRHEGPNAYENVSMQRDMVAEKYITL